MAKLINWNNFNQGFGESFNQTISELRRLREQREQFDQEMGFRERQLGLEQQRIEQTARYYDYLDKNLDLQKQGDIAGMYKEGFTPDTETPDVNVFGQGFDFPKPAPPEPVEQFLGSQVRSGIMEYMYGYPQEGDDVITKVDRTTIPSDILTPKEKTPYYDLTGSGEAFNKYKELQSGVPTEKGFNVTLGGKPIALTQKELESLKSQHIKNIELATDDEARKINSKVPGFYSTFQALLNIIESPNEIDSKVNEYLGGSSVETRDAIKTLLKRRIFE